MQTITNFQKLNLINFDEMKEDVFWNSGISRESLIHKVHVYPAKFPSLIAQKAFEYAESCNLHIDRVADVFCGCGTVAVESRTKGYNFWGCDLNPVAVLLSKVKTNIYNVNEVRRLADEIVRLFSVTNISNEYDNANQRLKYWYVENQYNELFLLKSIIEGLDVSSDYRDLFLCVFSSILKSTSKWLTKSIKPQVDPNKKVCNVIEIFKKHVMIFIRAISEESFNKDTVVEIKRGNALEIDKENYVDILVSSPPYVTSYEYGDLHQLSSLWLNYADDYKELRANSIGSQYNALDYAVSNLLPTASKIVKQMPHNSKTKAIARYFFQMNQVIAKCYKLLRSKGICVFVIGDTEYKGIKIENAKFLAESLINNGFYVEDIAKRRVQNKFLPSHRDGIGRFSSNGADRKIYSQEYIIIGRKV